MKVNLYGASGHAKVIMDIAQSVKHDVGIIYDDNKNVNVLQDIPVVHSIPLSILNESWIVSIGSNVIRKRIVKSNQFKYAKLIHNQAVISDNVCIGEGAVVMAGAIVNAGTNLGNHVIINTNCSVDHDCVISNFVHISPGATLCGNIVIGEGSHIGAGAVIIPGVKIGSWVTIGAGSTIISDVPDGVTIVGSPGKIIDKT